MSDRLMCSRYMTFRWVRSQSAQISSDLIGLALAGCLSSNSHLETHFFSAIKFLVEVKIMSWADGKRIIYEQADGHGTIGLRCDDEFII